MTVTESTPAKSVCLTCTSSSLHTASLNSLVVISPGSPPSNSVSSWPTQLLHPCLFPLLGFPLTQAGNLGYVCDVFFSFPSLPVTPKSSVCLLIYFFTSDHFLLFSFSAIILIQVLSWLLWFCRDLFPWSSCCLPSTPPLIWIHLLLI